MANQRDFLLELYKQTNQNLRDSDRNRNFFFEVYAAITVGALTLIAKSVINSGLKPLLIGGIIFLILFGIGTAIYVAFARKWHCEYDWSIKAIRECLQTDSNDLQKAGCSVKHNNCRQGIHYFHAAGTEFVVFMLVLMIIVADVSFIIYLLDNVIIRNIVYPILIVFIFSVGILGYWLYLCKKESDFPCKVSSLQTIQRERKSEDQPVKNED
jgi:hypothetical protein